eukprot:2629427-Karenia_brevis.AAC.1
MTRPLSRAQQESLQQGTLQLKPHKFLGFTTFKCGVQLQHLSRLCQDNHTTVLATWATPTTQLHYYTCPQGHSKDATQPFDIFDASKA